MQIALVGFSHRTVSHDFLGAASVPHAALPAFLQRLRNAAPGAEAVALSTCNRIEFYLAASDPEAAVQALLEALTGERGVPMAELSARATLLEQADAARHLLRVAAGLDSLVIGEHEILGQVRAALDTAREAGTAGTTLDRLFAHALRTGRRARAETAISRGRVSVATLAVQMLGEEDPALSTRRVLVIGAGEMGQQIAIALRERGVADIRIANRSRARAAALAQALGCLSLPMEDLPAALRLCEVVVCATSAPRAVVTARDAAQAGPRTYLDVSTPPGIAPDVAAVPGARLLTLADLEAAARENAGHRAAEAARADAIVERETAAWQSAAEAQPASELVAGLRRRVEAIRQAHLDRHAHRFPPAQREALDAMTRSLLNAVLHDLTANLSDLSDEEAVASQLDIARQLFAEEPATRA